jgi:hypothetical protein
MGSNNANYSKLSTICSGEHRSAFRKQFRWFFRLFSTQSTGTSANVVMVSSFNTVAGYHQQQQQKRNNAKAVNSIVRVA